MPDQTSESGREVHGVLTGFRVQQLGEQQVPHAVIRCCAPLSETTPDELCCAEVAVPLPAQFASDQVQLRALQDERAEYLEVSGRCEDCTERHKEEVWVSVALLAGFELTILEGKFRCARCGHVNSTESLTLFEAPDGGNAA